MFAETVSVKMEGMSKEDAKLFLAKAYGKEFEARVARMFKKGNASLEEILGIFVDLRKWLKAVQGHGDGKYNWIEPRLLEQTLIETLKEKSPSAAAADFAKIGAALGRYSQLTR